MTRIFKVAIVLLFATLVFIALLVGLGSVSCAPVVVPPGPDPDAEYCGAACGNLNWLGCDGWQGSPGPDERFHTADDITCETVCKSIPEMLNPRCVADAPTCKDAQACSNR